MNLKEQVTSQLNQLSESQLAKVSQYITQMQEQLPPSRIKNKTYLKTRESLIGIQGSMSQLIINERENRV